MAVGDGNEHSLHGRQPDREGAGKMLDDHRQKAFRRTHYGTMDHHRRVLLVVLGDVGESQPRRLNEIHLDGGELPLAAEHVVGEEVCLGTVEGGFAFGFPVVHLILVERSAQGGFGLVPPFRVIDIFAFFAAQG